MNGLDLESDIIQYTRNQIQDDMYYNNEAFDEYNNDMEENFFDKCNNFEEEYFEKVSKLKKESRKDTKKESNKEAKKDTKHKRIKIKKGRKKNCCLMPQYIRYIDIK